MGGIRHSQNMNETPVNLELSAVALMLGFLLEGLLKVLIFHNIYKICHVL
jgi:hypothetical protein